MDKNILDTRVCSKKGNNLYMKNSGAIKNYIQVTSKNYQGTEIVKVQGVKWIIPT